MMLPGLSVLLALAATADTRAGVPQCRPANPRSPFSIAVTAIDYSTARPVPGAVFTVSHRVTCSKAESRDGGPQCTPTHPHPGDVLKITCAAETGRAAFAVPDLDYEVQVAGPAPTRYLAPWEIAKFARALEVKERLQETSHNDRRTTMTVITKLVPAAVIEAPSVITTPERAAEVARAALTQKGCNPNVGVPPPPGPARAPDDGKPRPRLGRPQMGLMPPGKPVEPRNYWGQWRVEFPIASVDVNAIDNSARIVRCGADCCRDPKDEPTAGPVYSPFEALDDASAQPWEYVGTTVWPGVFQIPSCIYRNKRVIVVNVYCTRKEINTSSILVMHPERGRVKVYAESDAPISTIDASRYQQWKLMTEDPPPAGAVPSALRTSMTLAELLTYERQRAGLYLPGCWVEHWSPRTFPPGTSPAVIKNFERMTASSGQGNCRHKSSAVTGPWASLAAGFSQPPPSWYALLKRMRALAPKHGKADPRTARPDEP